MKHSCVLGRHTAAPGAIRNQGLDFGRCRRCGRDLVRSRRAWRAVPAGFRVVWRRPRAPAATQSAGQLLLDLPAAGRALALRPGRAPRRSWAAAALELAFMAARWLAWTLADRVRAWMTSLRAPLVIRQPVLGLTAA